MTNGIKVREINNKEWEVLQKITTAIKADWFYMIPLKGEDVIVHDLELDLLIDLRDAVLMLHDGLPEYYKDMGITRSELKTYSKLYSRLFTEL